jgi:hypothetical protein
MMFLVPSTLTQAEVDRVCEVMRRVMGVAGAACQPKRSWHKMDLVNTID